MGGASGMIFRTIESIIKIFIFALFIILLIGYPIVIHGVNPFIYYYELIFKIIEGIKQIKGLA